MPIVENINPAPIANKILQPGRRTKVTPEKARELVRTGNFRIVHKSLKTEDDKAIARFVTDETPEPPPKAKPPRRKKKTT